MRQFNHITLLSLCIITILLFNVSLSAQVNIIRGKVADSTSQSPVAGATVFVRNSNIATSTNASGEFSINASSQDELIISSVGYESQTIRVTGNNLQITLAQTSRQLNEVVVTALGIKKETKRLGYSVQEVKGEDLLKAREPNPINSLVGKVAGLTVGASAEMLQGPQLVLRGRSIGLFVVDGVPINSDTWNISPDDIETFTVLKGSTAAALYGFRGINGAIMITYETWYKR
jgi:TonB-dependent SusC/RagA subfamily outer membrane receptor